MRWGCVDQPYWDDRPVALVGNGPSLKGFDFERLRDRFHVVAIKGAIFSIPWATAGFGLDFPRYQEWHQRLFEVRVPTYWACVSFSQFPRPQPACITFLRRIDMPAGLSEDPRYINAGGTSGFGAFNVAWLKRARKVVLFGYDYQPDNHGNWHYDEKPYRQQRKQVQSLWDGWLKKWEKVHTRIKDRGVEVINACPTSKLSIFPKLTIDEALNG
jgi:hypothetical protein